MEKELIELAFSQPEEIINNAELYYTQIEGWGKFSFGAGGGGSTTILYLGDLVRLWNHEEFKLNIPRQEAPSYIVSATFWTTNGKCLKCETVSSSNSLPIDRTLVCTKDWRKIIYWINRIKEERPLFSHI